MESQRQSELGISVATAGMKKKKSVSRKLLQKMKPIRKKKRTCRQTKQSTWNR